MFKIRHYISISQISASPLTSRCRPRLKTRGCRFNLNTEGLRYLGLLVGPCGPSLLRTMRSQTAGLPPSHWSLCKPALKVMLTAICLLDAAVRRAHACVYNMQDMHWVIAGESSAQWIKSNSFFLTCETKVIPVL